MAIGTVKGDIHDVGKNLVSMMMEAAGFEVIDLGINTAAATYLDAVKVHQPDILGMSALLTTTMHYMKVVIEAIEQEGLRDDVIVMVGGAPVTQEYADVVGADGYAPDAASATKRAKELLEQRRAPALA
jgi:methylmalonyl-CoA mutase cobalamin-binding domain/chain